MTSHKAHKNKQYSINCKDGESTGNEQASHKDTDLSHCVVLSHLKKESEQMHCPYCSQCVKTTTSRGSMMDYLLIFGLTGITFRIPTFGQTVMVSLFIYFVFYRNEITHKCSSCYKKVAVYSKISKATRVQAPSFGSDLDTLPCVLSHQSVTANEKLGNQSEFIRCPHCSCFAYSKVSGGGDIGLFLSLYGLIIWFPFVTYNLILPFHYYPAIVMVIYLFFGTHKIRHKCPSCFKKIATFNIFTGKTTIALAVTFTATLPS